MADTVLRSLAEVHRAAEDAEPHNAHGTILTAAHGIPLPELDKLFKDGGSLVVSEDGEAVAKDKDGKIVPVSEEGKLALGDAPANEPEKPGFIERATNTITSTAKKTKEAVVTADLNDDGKPDVDQAGSFLGNNGVGLGALILGALLGGMFGGWMGALIVGLLAFAAGSLFGDKENGILAPAMSALGMGGQEKGQTIGLAKEPDGVSAAMGSFKGVDGEEYNVALHGQEAGSKANFDSMVITRKGDADFHLEQPFGKLSFPVAEDGTIKVPGGAIEETTEVAKDMVNKNAKVSDARARELGDQYKGPTAEVVQNGERATIDYRELSHDGISVAIHVEGALKDGKFTAESGAGTAGTAAGERVRKLNAKDFAALGLADVAVPMKDGKLDTGQLRDDLVAGLTGSKFTESYVAGLQEFTSMTPPTADPGNLGLFPSQPAPAGEQAGKETAR